MAHLPLAHQLFLAGVVGAFATFILVVGGTYLYVNLKA